MANGFRDRRGVFAAGLLLGASIAAHSFEIRAEPYRPAAIVEDIAADDATVQFMEYLAAGTRIDLGPTGRVTLGYLRSCWIETITGGFVVVGDTQSVVEGGQVERKRVDCDGALGASDTALADESGVSIFRRAPLSGADTLPKPDRHIYATYPFVMAKKRIAALRLQRLDRDEAPRKITVDAGHLDFRLAGLSLKPGGIYALSTTEDSVVIKVDRLATSEPVSVLERLVQF